MFYRIHQFLQASSPHLETSEISWALDNLPPGARPLFLRQSKSEQRHALDVAQSLMGEKNTLTVSNYQKLIVAALLHDCGKSIVSIHLWQRVFIVLMQKMPHSFWSRLERSATILAAPLKTASQHALWGANLAKKAGVAPEICLLIHDHHSPNTKLGRLLKRADNAH